MFSARDVSVRKSVGESQYVSVHETQYVADRETQYVADRETQYVSIRCLSSITRFLRTVLFRRSEANGV